MGVQEKRTNASQRRMLEDIGVTVWVARGAPSPAEEPAGAASHELLELPAVAEPAAQVPISSNGESVPAAQTAPIAFHWLAGPAGAVLFAPSSDKVIWRFASDLCSAMSWLAGAHQSKPAAPRKGQFQWPQLATTVGTPQQALQVLVQKLFADVEMPRLILDASLLEQIAPWVELDAVLVATTADLGALKNDAPGKAQLWQQLIEQ